MRSNKGFTLIELLVAIAIISILAAIALPFFSEHRAKSFCSRAVSDAKNAYVAMEAYYAAELMYGSLEEADFSPGSKDVTITIDSTDPLVVSATDDTGLCPLGTTYTLSEASGVGQWS